MALHLKDKNERVAVITGASPSIGADIALTLQAQGLHVVNLDLDEAAIDSSLLSSGSPVYTCNGSNFEQVTQVLSQIEKDISVIGVLVHNAGIIKGGLTHKKDRISQWQSVIVVILTGGLNTCRAVLPKMRDQEWGRIINFSSMNALHGHLGRSNYAASKASV